MRRILLLILVLGICGGCDSINVESNTNRSANDTPSRGLDPVDPEGDEEDTEQTFEEIVEELDTARGFEVPVNDDRAETFANEIEAVTTPGASPNLTGTWIWTWTRSGSFDPKGDPNSTIDLFQYFGFEILWIEDNGDGSLSLNFCFDHTPMTLFYNGSDELSLEAEGPTIGAIDSSTRFTLTQAIRGGIEYPDTIDYVNGTVKKDVFTRMTSDLGSIIARMTTTEPAGPSYSQLLTCVVYWETAYNNAEGAQFDNFHMFRGPEAGAGQGSASELNNSFYVQELQKIVAYINDSRFSGGPVVREIELGEF